MHREYMVYMGDKVICRFHNGFPGGSVFQHRHQLGYEKAETDGSGFGINNSQVEIRVLFQHICFGDMGRIKGSGDTSGKANVDHGISGLCIGEKGFFKHSRIDMVSTDVPFGIV